MSRLARLVVLPVLAGSCLLGLAPLAGASSASSAPPACRPARAAAPSATAAGTEKVVTCAGKAVVRPSNFVITCADSGWVLNKIRWSSWAPGKATAKATFTENLCTPDCAAGKYASYPATVTLSGQKKVKLGLVYTELRWQYEAGGKLEHESFRLLTSGPPGPSGS